MLGWELVQQKKEKKRKESSKALRKWIKYNTGFLEQGLARSTNDSKV